MVVLFRPVLGLTADKVLQVKLKNFARNSLALSTGVPGLDTVSSAKTQVKP
jgi:hypothetical protein